MLEPKNIVEDDIAFTIAPRINVASRLAHPRMAFDLLTATSFDGAMRIAKDLNNINNRRKTMVAQIMKQAHAKVRESKLNQDPVLVIGNPDWKPPVLGLVATQLIKAYGRPTFVWGRDDSGAYKGSARSTPDIDIVQLMYTVPDEVFINKGGHAQSGGFCVHPDHIFDFDNAMQTAFAKIYGAKVETGINAEVEGGDASNELGRNVQVSSTHGKVCHLVDAIISVNDINPRTFAMIEKLSPYGVGNEKPLFAITDFHIKNARLFGKTGEHLELEHGDWDNGQVKAIQFFYTEGSSKSGSKKPEDITSLDDLKQDPLLALKQNTHKAIIGCIEKNQFRGANEIRLRIIDMV